MRLRNGDHQNDISGLIFGLVLLAFSLAGLIGLKDIVLQGGGFDKTIRESGAGFLPAVYIAIIFASGAGLVLFDAARLYAARRNVFAECVRGYLRSVNARELTLSFLIVGLYVVLIEWSGYLIATFLFQVLFMRFVFNKSGYVWLLLVPILATALYFYLFGMLLHVPLPRGVGVFYTFNRNIF